MAGTALSQRPRSRRPRRCAAPSPPARGRLTSSRAAAAATAGNTWQWPPPLALLASPLLSAPARAAPARRTTAPGALCRREAESSRPNPNSPAAPARRPAPASPAPGRAPSLAEKQGARGPRAASGEPAQTTSPLGALPLASAQLGQKSSFGLITFPVSLNVCPQKSKRSGGGG